MAIIKITPPNWLRNLPNLLPKIEIGNNNQQSNFPRQQILSSGYGYNDFITEKESILREKIDFEKLSQETFKEVKLKADLPSTSYKLQPSWFVYENMYNTLMFVSSAVNKKANTMKNLKGSFKDINGVVNNQLFHDFEEQFGLKRLIPMLSKQLDIFGTTIVMKKKGWENDKYPVFLAVPASQTQNFIVNISTLQVESFSWNRSDIFQYETIKKRDNKKDLNFFVYSDPDVSDQFFASPRLQSAFTTLDGYLRDEQNYQLFLKNASFPGVLAFVSGENQEATEVELQSYFASLRDSDSRFKAGVIKNTIDSNGNPTISFNEIKQSIENRLGLAEKQEIAGLVYDNLFIPRIIMGENRNAGIGVNEFEPAMTMYKRDCLEPQAKDIEHIINSFISPEGLKEMEKNKYFEQKQIKTLEYGVERIATAKDFHFDIGEVALEDFNSRVRRGLELFNSGSILNSDLKTKYLGYKPEEVAEEDKFRKLPNGVAIVKEGELKEGTVGAEDSTKDVQDEIKEDIGDGKEITQETTAPKNETTDPTKIKSEFEPKEFLKFKAKTQITQSQIQGIVQNESIKVWKSSKNKQKVKEFLIKAIPSKISLVPDLLNTIKAKELKKALETDLLRQYSSLDFKKLKLPQKSLEIKEKADLEEEAFKKDLANQILLQLPDLNIDLNSFTNTLLFFARLGASYSEQISFEENGVNLSQVQKDDLINQINEFLTKRTNNLLNGLANGETVDQDDITNPNYDGSLNQTSLDEITNLINSLIKENPEADENTLKGLFLAGVVGLIGERANLIMAGEISKAFNLALYLAGETLGAKKYTWLHTTAKNPDKVHLTFVGQTKTPKEFGTNPGARFGCQCSWKPVFFQKI